MTKTITQNIAECEEKMAVLQAELDMLSRGLPFLKKQKILEPIIQAQQSPESFTEEALRKNKQRMDWMETATILGSWSMPELKLDGFHMHSKHRARSVLKKTYREAIDAAMKWDETP